ncbi:hypothetical protein H072_3956 [Dactylellina haptotyla CBS 200.50]|uniref:Uncharacterized protein n=1 Tax=Dactylellina haptotyla (strain CBS 200.50) TaxID=1284197 RepID=S8AG59_DACHA|nr:hypothetical protein H072_3956 [Dactylellina haptotyla CBS 200.50]
MRVVDFIAIATFVGLSASAPLQSQHMNSFRKRDKQFGMCNVVKNVRLPSYPTSQSYIIGLESPNPPTASVQQVLHNRRRVAFWGNPTGDPTDANAFFPHWYHWTIYDGVTNAQSQVEVVDSASIPAGEPNWGNVDHVFEHFTLRQFLGKMMGMGDPLVPASMVANDAECLYWQTTFNGKPRHYPATPATYADNGLLSVVYQYLPGVDQANPEKYPNGEFAGLSTVLNTMKGHVFEANMQEMFDDNKDGYAKGTGETDLVNRMGDIEKVAVVFELMRKPKMQSAYKKTCLRLSKVMYGIDDYLTRGNKADFASADAPFTMENGNPYGSFGDEFKIWLRSYLQTIGIKAKAFADARIASLRADLDDPNVTATNKAQIETRLAEFTTAQRHSTPFFTLPIDTMIEFAADASQKIALYKMVDTDADPFAKRPFTNVA